jgi:hypothetical protein
MKLKTTHLSLAALLCGVLVAQTSWATAILTEEFINYSTGQLGASGTGGGGTIPGWNTASTNIWVTNGSGSLNGKPLGLVQSFGDRAFIYANAGFATNGSYNKFVGLGVFPQSTNVNIYYSFLYKFDTGTEVSPTGQIISAVNRENSGVTTTGSFHWLLHARNSGGNLQLGISKNGGGAITNWTGTSTNWASTNIPVGQTVFVVVRQQIITGVSNDVEDLWINPPTNSFGTNEANIPPVSATTSDGAEDQSTTGPGRFWIFYGLNAEMDEIRIATNWADATPPVNQCITAGFTAQPTNITQVAEINAILSFDSDSTGASYQWQLSKDHGTTWSNIQGAIAITYTTPNLALATDNGNQYRAIVNVPCDNSSATSAVATVTLTAPVITPDSLIMDDNFSDQLRDNTPVTTNNSVWRTATPSANLDATSGQLVATTVSAKSTLYWGQFVDDATSRVPVHLDVGHQIKVTLPFTPNSFNAFTGNGALRFGLYDYADGGTFITTDDNTATGSTGNGVNVRGYMLSVDFGTNFSANSPLSLLVKNGMEDINLMGTTGDYLSMGSGPSGGGYSNAPAFSAGTQYTLVLTVTRTDVNNCTVGATITGGGTNWTWSAAETNGFAYHRFDVFAIRANSAETAADTFTIPEFKVEVLTAAVTPTPIPLKSSYSGGNLVLSWVNPAGSTFTLAASGSLSGPYTNVTTTSPYTAPTTGSQTFYRLRFP